MVVKGISREDFPKNCLGELSNSSSRRLTHDCFRKMIQQFTSNGSPIYLPKLGSVFSKTKIFCFENGIFSHLAEACVRESMRARDMGVGGSHSHPYHVDI